MNELIEKITIIKIVNTSMFFIILTAYGMATYWNIKTYIMTRGLYHAGLILYSAISTFFFFCIYTYLFIQAVLGNFEEANTAKFGLIFIRPAILLLGGALASVARARYLALKNGGDTWIFPK